MSSATDGTILRLVAESIKSGFGSLDDLPDELANTIANFHYRFFKSMRESSGDIHIPLRVIQAPDVGVAMQQWIKETSTLSATFNNLPKMISALRDIKHQSSASVFEYTVTLMLDDLKFGIDNAMDKSPIRRAIERKLKRPNEIASLYRRLRPMMTDLPSAGAAIAPPYEGAIAADQRGDDATGLRRLEPLAAQGDARAQTQLGLMYAGGQGVAQNYVEAVKWYRLAAAQGNARAQIFLGARYHDGQGVAKDYVEAAKWFRLAAAQGDASAQTVLGAMYHNGEGVAQNDAESVKWYRLAAVRGYSRAQNDLGTKYHDGEGVAKDYIEAVKWFRLAAAQGDARAQHNLGAMYFTGQGVAQDYVRAHMWFDLAGASGDVNGMKARDMAAARMTPQQIAEAQKMARECQQHNFKDCD